ncbi:Rad17 cell cycle checkpoint protein-domain-containing protein [Amylocarpus encephaloides]|uniref:Rad17 cell cycle checkpoint protein-domain-containing protein n=1 Tax=Amylocarpus encephaloides TaxID=45428 RepID=A0A9P8CAL6_9HELO|nr:Rad17 cell cycle checkpoint protein-domain-containing protein [Amylocarpus encephaloides]
MAHPAKRRKWNSLPSLSDSDDEAVMPKPAAQTSTMRSSIGKSSADTKPTSSANIAIQTKPVLSKRPPRATTANHPHNAAPMYLPKPTQGRNGSTKSPSSSPEKSKRKPKFEDKVKSGDIFTFFTKQAQRQKAEGIKTGGRRIPSNISKEDELDLISDDDDVLDSRASSSSFIGKTAQKRGLQNQSKQDVNAPSTSQKFMKKPKPMPTIRVEEDRRPWAEKFGPKNLEELAVHKKKVADVRGWLEDVMGGRMRQRLLLLKGGAGTGKTTTIQLLADAMDCEILEWRNPIGSIAAADGYQSMAAQFEEFLGRGGKFGQLDIFSANDSITSKPDIKPLDRRKRIILVEEFPNTFTRSSSALQSFRDAILQYLASNTPSLSMFHSNDSSKYPVTPLVMIISETLLVTTSASADSFTAHRLLGPKILQHPGVGVIEFNAIAPTLLTKAIDTVVQKESRKSGRRKTPGPLVLKKLGEIGDIRSAIGSLEFLCLRGDDDGDWGAKVAFGKSKKREVALTKMEEESLEMVTRREASLGIFHAVGKVVYNKRDEAALSLPWGEDVEKLPSFMSLHARPKRSQVYVDQLIDETGTDTQTFVAALHENYLLSCDAPSTSFDFTSLDHVNGCIDALSDSDLLCPSWGGAFNSTGLGSGTGGRGSGGDILRQDEITFQIAVRGILFSLPNPVKRQAPAANGLRTGKGGDAFKMFYPTSLKLWRMKEEIESTIDLWVTKLMKGEEGHLSNVTAGASAFARPNAGTVEGWRNPRSTTSKGKDKDTNSTPLLSIGTSARKEMLLERLPYMTVIAKSRRTTSSSLGPEEMEKVTVFRGIGASSDDSPENDDDTATPVEEWATDKPGDSTGKSPKKKGLVIRGRGAGIGLPLPKMEEQKFVLSDDDIEDD